MTKDLFIPKEYIDKKLIGLNLFLFIISLIFGCSYFWFRENIDPTVLYAIIRSIALSIILMNLPDLICSFSGMKFYGMVTIFVLIFFSLLGFVSGNISSVLILFAIIILIFQIIRFIILSQNSVNKLYYIILYVIFTLLVGISLVTTFYNQGYHHPLFIEKISIGLAHMDTLFHVAISQLFLNYQIPSTGLHGLKWLHYHTGSHMLFAVLAKLIGLKPIVFYNLAYPIIFIPFFLKAVFITILKLQESYKSYTSTTYLLLSFFGFTLFLAPIILNIENSPFISESYTVAIGFSFFFFSDLFNYFEKTKKKNYNFVLFFFYFSLAIIILLYLKVSVGLLFFILVSYFLFRELSLKSLFLWTFLTLNFMILYLFYKSLDVSFKSELPIKTIFKLNFESLKFYIWPYFLTLLYFISNNISLNKNGYQRLKEKFLLKETLYLELLLVVSFFGSLPSFILLNLTQPDIYYFSSYQYFLGIVIGIPYVYHLIPESIKNIHLNKIRIILLATFIFYSLFLIEPFYTKCATIAADKNRIIQNSMSNKNYIFIKNILSYTYKKNSVFYIPKENMEFWQMQTYCPLGQYFVIPATTGLPQLFSIPDSASNKGQCFTGYPKIQNPKSLNEVIVEAKKLGYSNLYIVDRNLKIEQINL